MLLTGAVALVAITCRSSAEPTSSDVLALRVLVELRLPAGVAELDAGDARRRAEIDAAADRLTRALDAAEIEHEVVRRYDTIPWIALRIAPADRGELAALPG